MKGNINSNSDNSNNIFDEENNNLDIKENIESIISVKEKNSINDNNYFNINEEVNREFSSEEIDNNDKNIIEYNEDSFDKLFKRLILDDNDFVYINGKYKENNIYN